MSKLTTKERFQKEDQEEMTYGETKWIQLNKERGLLIDKKIAGTLTEEESIHLDGLNAYADVYLQRKFPKPEPPAVTLGRLGGKKGGKARAEKLSPERRKEIAEKAADARWAKKQEDD